MRYIITTMCIAILSIAILKLDLTKIVFGGKIPKQEIRINTMSSEQYKDCVEIWKHQIVNTMSKEQYNDCLEISKRQFDLEKEAKIEVFKRTNNANPYEYTEKNGMPVTVIPARYEAPQASGH